ncbi:MAG: flagellar basal body P-ring protein FlgI [Planctomycetaceae bacterium]|nr:flagellar basal body P-ring protein FlgI [Planctomycetaceae bacterium]
MSSRAILNRSRWVWAVCLALCPTLPVDARVRLENICTLQGQQEVRLTGLGLVVGLDKTGDGGKNLPTIRALQAALSRMNSPTGPADLKNGDNVAVVMVEATIPRSGLRKGQAVDCYVSAVMGAKSLRGGRLLSTPLTSIHVRDETVWGLAGGKIIGEGVSAATTGRINQGVTMQRDATPLFLKQQSGTSITLMIDPNHASFWTSSEVSRVVNSEFSFEVGGQQVARPLSPNAVEVLIPPQYQETPVDFVAQVLDIGIDVPHTQAKVILNSSTGTVIVTGEVEISPVVISHKSFRIEIGGPDPSLSGPFVGIIEGQGRQSPQQLEQLVKALNQLRVPSDDIISIVRELHATGKLHAELLDH